VRADNTERNIDHCGEAARKVDRNEQRVTDVLEDD
jgi:hypothetical protein